ncbi:PepSY-associated TM helix domain-containing protein [Paraburkholderia phosphatilytica]|uniref:PepSY-associated TM helix domain-containing protein n=1 Tax=Paraburkholderia phosphatilytica TaxID=2282883 RepID=UPI000E532492|nr:PepSY-associated TM helix domain-containing protein [Paraburkholderia phosphatilytica]
MRPLFVKLHRWFGIGIALFLFMSGLTGAIIAWNQELDATLNPGFFHARVHTPPPSLSALELANRVEAADPRIRVTYLPLGIQPGDTLQIRVEPRIDPATRAPYKVDYNQVAVDPATGDIQGRRDWGKASLSRLNLMPFLYLFHYTLYLPAVGNGFETGMWVLGVVSIVWLFDSMIALGLAFPSLRAWRKSFAFRVKRGGYALTFDLHRSGGVWIWGLLIVIAVTSISLNLPTQVMRPVLSLFTTLSKTPFTDVDLQPRVDANAATLSREHIVELATQVGRERHIGRPPGAIFYEPEQHVYGVGFFRPGGDYGDGPLGNAWTYWNASTGALISTGIPGRGSAGDIFLQAQFPLHSGRMFGLPGRIVVSFMGVMVATLSVTGLMIWLKKLNARRRSAQAKAVVQVPRDERVGS